MRIAVIQLFVLIVIYLATCDAGIDRQFWPSFIIRLRFVAKQKRKKKKTLLLFLGYNNDLFDPGYTELFLFMRVFYSAVPQILKSQSLIPFPRVGRSRSAFIANAIGSSARGAMLNAAGSNNNNNKPNNWMVGYNLIKNQKKNDQWPSLIDAHFSMCPTSRITWISPSNVI